MARKPFATKIILSDDKVCQSCIDTLTLCGDTFISDVGRIKYTTDQSDTYTARSLVDKGYITGLTTSYHITGITTNKTLTSVEQLVLVNTTSSSVTITLPAAGQVCLGKYYLIKNTACGLTNNIIIDSGVGSIIDDSRCALINTDLGGMHISLACTSGSCSTWYVLEYIG